VIVIDNAIRRPEEVVAQAAGTIFAPDHRRGVYPGIRADAPRAYGMALLRRASLLIERAFGLRIAEASRVDAVYSLLTTPPSEQRPMQRLPHIDAHDPRRIAILHYLCRGAMGGTGFFRQATTGLEQIDQVNFQRYLKQWRSDVDRLGNGQKVGGGEMPGYVETAHLEARFNRLIIYRTFSLHSAIVPEDFECSADPRRGRLTGNIFVEFGKMRSVAAA
jgi:hypothetical protein